MSILFIVFCLLSFSSSVYAQTSNPVVVRIVPKESRAAVGQFVDVAVEVVNVTDLYAIDVLLAFDSQALEVVDQDPALDGVQVQLGTLLEPGFVILNLVDNSLGRLRLAMTQLNPTSPKSGTGTIVVVRFLAKAASTQAGVEVLAAKFSSPAGEEIPVEALETARIEVVQTLAGPTKTSIPAQDPGTPMPTSVPPTAVSTLSGQQITFPTQPLPDYLNLQPTATSFIPPTAAPTQAPAASTSSASQITSPAETSVPLTETRPVNPRVTATSASPLLKATEVAQSGEAPATTPGSQSLAGDSTTTDDAVLPSLAILAAGVLLAGIVLAAAGLAIFLLVRRRKRGGI